MAPSPGRGEIWAANLSPVRGREQAGDQLVLVISTNGFNQGAADLVFVLPLTRTDRRIPLHIPIDPPEGGVTSRSFIVCDALRSISRARLRYQSWGTISAETLAQVEDVLRLLLEL